MKRVTIENVVAFTHRRQGIAETNDFISGIKHTIDYMKAEKSPFHLMICFEILMLDGAKKTCCHENFKKSQYPTTAFLHATKYCERFDYKLPKGAYSWFTSRVYAANEEKMKQEIKDRAFASKIYPIEQIASIHLKIQRITTP